MSSKSVVHKNYCMTSQLHCTRLNTRSLLLFIKKVSVFSSLLQIFVMATPFEQNKEYVILKDI